MTTIRTTYRIDDTNGIWGVISVPNGGNVTMEVAESYYDRLRDDHPTVELRLIQVTEHQVRSGKGKVYD